MISKRSAPSILCCIATGNMSAVAKNSGGNISLCITTYVCVPVACVHGLLRHAHIEFHLKLQVMPFRVLVVAKKKVRGDFLLCNREPSYKQDCSGRPRPKSGHMLPPSSGSFVHAGCSFRVRWASHQKPHHTSALTPTTLIASHACTLPILS